MNFLGIVLSVLTALIVFVVIGFVYLSRTIEDYVNNSEQEDKA
jgi:uncharacterized protein YneF (UPF0154 family)